MNNIQIKMSSGEIIPVELISSFELINISKKYIFYTKNEVVENNLIKMYVAEIMNINGPISVGEKMSDQEWTNLKNVMKSILTGNENTNVKYIEIGDYKLENVINIKEPNVIAIDNAKKTKFKEVYETAIKNNHVDIAQNINQAPAPVESIVSTPAEILANELAVEPMQQNVVNTPMSEPVLEENINTFNVQTPINKEIQNETFAEENEFSNNEKNINDLNNDIVLRIINNITELQRKLDSIGEDVIKLSNLYQTPQAGKVVNNEIPTNTEPTIDEEPETSIVDTLISENLFSQPVPQFQPEPQVQQPQAAPVLSDEISPFSMGTGNTNIFDQPEQGRVL